MHHQLGKCWRNDLGVLPDDDKAELWFRQSADTGNGFSQYALGKLYLDRQDREQAHYWFSWFSQSASQGNEYAQFFLDRWDNQKPSSVMLSVMRLLHHMSEILQDNSVPPQAPAGQLDRKLRLKIRKKKIAMGHKLNDHEEQSQGQSTTMG